MRNIQERICKARKARMQQVIGFVIIFLAILAYSVVTNKYDDTDDIDTHTWSGMQLHTDHGTGCQYLRVGFFSKLTPRMDGSGKQVCSGK